MDGYAVRAEDVAQVPATLRIVAEIPAGAGFGGTARPGRGGAHLHRRALPMAPMRSSSRRTPSAAATGRGQGGAPRRPLCPPRRARFRRGRRAAARRAAADAARCRPGRGDEPAVAVRSIAGRASRILSTGDEIVMPGDPIGPHQIVSSNALALCALVTAWGGVPVLVGNARDDPDAIAPDRGGGARRRSVGDHGRRLGRRARPGARRAVGRGLRDRFLADRDAAGQAPDVRPIPRHADGWPARQSGFDAGLRAGVPETGARPAERPAERN